MSELENIYEILGILCYLNFPSYLNDTHINEPYEIKNIIKNKIKKLINYIEILELNYVNLTNLNSKQDLKKTIEKNKLKLNQMISDYNKII